GVPRNVSADGMMMDVDHYQTTAVQKNNNAQEWVQNNRMQGARMSAMEAMVSELMFSTEQNSAHGISAVKAIELAAAQGQKIYTITQANLSVALNTINFPYTVEDT